MGLIRGHLRSLSVAIYINPIENYAKVINKYFTAKETEMTCKQLNIVKN